MATFYDDLKEVEGALYQPASIDTFLAKRPVSELLVQLTKTKEPAKKFRLEDFFRKLTQTEHIKDIILSYRAPQKQKQTAFHNFVKSSNSQLFFTSLQNHPQFLINLLQQDAESLSMLFGLISHEYGVKIMRTFIKLYKNYPNSEVLYSSKVKDELVKGLENKDTIIQMRFMELIVTVATFSEKAFQFMKGNGLLHRAVELYDTKDILLKLNVAEVIEIFGNSPWTIQFLKDDEHVWKLILDQAFDPQTEFYVRKFLIQLITKMHASGCFKFTPEISKNIVLFLKSCLNTKNYEEISSALSVIGNLNKTYEGVKLVIGSAEIIRPYVAIAHTNKDELKGKFVTSLSDLAIKGSKPDNIVISVLSCVGDNSIAKVQNFKQGHGNAQGLGAFTKWFLTWASLPFQDLQLQCIFLFRELLEYKTVCVELFQSPLVISFLKLKGKEEFLIAKNNLIKDIMKRGETEWQGHQLAEFCKVLKTELNKKPEEEMQYEVVSK